MPIWRMNVSGILQLLYFCVAICPVIHAQAGKQATLDGGFSKVRITPSLGTRMTGFGERDHDPAGGARGVHDDLYARALYLEQGPTQVLIMAFDLCFLSRDEADRYRGAVARKFGVPVNNILLNASHTHTGPKVGRWFYTPRNELYLDQLEAWILEAAGQAIAAKVPVTMEYGETTSELPLSRRLPNPQTGKMDFRPNPKGTIDPGLPVALFRDVSGGPVALLFSVAAHPSNIKGDDRAYQVSADFPGVACDLLDAHLGKACSLFLQGAAGSAKCRIVYDQSSEDWKAGTWDDVQVGGRMIADETIALLRKGLDSSNPGLRASSVEMEWQLQPVPSRRGFEDFINNPETNSESMPEVKQMWAREQISKLEQGYELPQAVPITLQGIRLGDGLRIIAIEGEAVAELGLQVGRFFAGQGVTFRLGYSNGVRGYLPISKMLPEGGYEVESYWEYRNPAPFAPGMEQQLENGLIQLKATGID